jgi:invasion protein IalB
MNVTRAYCFAILTALGILCASRVISAQPRLARQGHASEVEPAGSANQTLPGGADSLQEAHGDWRVACVHHDGQKQCSLSQQVMDKDSRQRILAIELTTPSPGQAEGTLVLPFGLALDKGVTLQVDDAAAGPTLRFRTCLPAGCVVAVTFDAKAVAALRTGTTLTVKATGENTQEVSLSVSLKGFASALDRIVALAK